MALPRVINLKNGFVATAVLLAGCSNSGSLPCTPDSFGTAGDAVTSTCTQRGTLESSARNLDPTAVRDYLALKAKEAGKPAPFVIPATVAGINAPNGTQMGISDGLQAAQLVEGGIGLKLQSEYNNQAAKAGQSAPTVPQFLPSPTAATPAGTTP